MQDRVYKIFTANEWQAFQKSGRFGGSADDLRDGFIHLSTGDQVTGVIDRFFAGKGPLYVAEFASSGFQDNLKWEPAASGEIYPHLYGEGLVLNGVTNTSKVGS